MLGEKPLLAGLFFQDAALFQQDNAFTGLGC